MAKHKGESTIGQTGESTTLTVGESTIPDAAKHTHDIHESSDADNIYRSCRTCPFSETIPRK